jgi:hypothetical protein
MSYKAEHRGVRCEFTIREDGNYLLRMIGYVEGEQQGLRLMYPPYVIERAKCSERPIRTFLIDTSWMAAGKPEGSRLRRFLETAVSIMENEMAYAIPTREPEMTDNEEGMQIEVSNIDYGNLHQVTIRQGDDNIVLSYGLARILLGNQTLEDAVIADLLKIHKDTEQPESRRALALRAGMRVAEGWGFGTMRQSVLQIPTDEPPTPVRAISGHAAPSDRDDVTIVAADDPGPGGANHEYLIDLGNGATPIAIDFQKNNPRDWGRDGVTNEMLLAIVIDRLESFQAGPYPSGYNEVALLSCRAALAALHERTEERRKRGVEGASKA